MQNGLEKEMCGHRKTGGDTTGNIWVRDSSGWKEDGGSRDQEPQTHTEVP